MEDDYDQISKNAYFYMHGASNCMPGSFSFYGPCNFSDMQLETAVRQALARPAGLLTAADLARLKTLDASRQNITNLSGLEYAVNLENLNLFQNKVEDLDALAGLTRLRVLNLGSNRINHIGALRRLTALEELKIVVRTNYL
ncbi:MAG: leucine-rich repeat domain-containing protein [Bacillota bacterium]|nr:leucine-rich repeat domain-containing protein [Bacillota bacterium]